MSAEREDAILRDTPANDYTIGDRRGVSEESPVKIPARGATSGTNAADETIRKVGSTIRARRKQVNMTLNDLAESTGVSVSMLSMLERGVAGASIGTLVAVASALRLQMHDLFDHPETDEVSPVTPRAAQTEVETSEGVVRRIAHHAADRGLEMAVNEYAPGTASGDKPVHHGGREYGIVISGSLTVELDGTSYKLRAGDAISYDSSTPHRIANEGRSPARAVWVNLLD